MIVYSREQFLPLEQVTVPVTDHGYLYGVGLFETFRSWHGGRFLFLDRHLARLLDGCELLGIRAEALRLAAEATLRPVLTELLDRNEMEDAVFRYTVSAGEIPGGGLPDGPYESPRESILVRPVPDEPPAPITLHVLNTVRTPPETPRRIKSAHYFNCLSAWRELRQSGAPGDEGILLAANGKIVEGATTNVFFVRGRTILTPPPETGLLPGIVRAAVLDLAHKAGVSLAEKDLRAGDLDRMDAAFVTNAAVGIRPAGAIQTAPGTERFALDPDHPVIRVLRQGWNRRLDRLRA